MCGLQQMTQLKKEIFTNFQQFLQMESSKQKSLTFLLKFKIKMKKQLLQTLKKSVYYNIKQMEWHNLRVCAM